MGSISKFIKDQLTIYSLWLKIPLNARKTESSFHAQPNSVLTTVPPPLKPRPNSEVTVTVPPPLKPRVDLLKMVLNARKTESSFHAQPNSVLTTVPPPLKPRPNSVLTVTVPPPLKPRSH